MVPVDPVPAGGVTSTLTRQPLLLSPSFPSFGCRSSSPLCVTRNWVLTPPLVPDGANSADQRVLPHPRSRVVRRRGLAVSIRVEFRRENPATAPPKSILPFDRM